MTKKLTRGIDEEFARAFKKSELSTLYQDHKDELLIGVRNNYLDLYYKCDKVAEIRYDPLLKKITGEFNKYYLDDEHHAGKNKIQELSHCKILERYDTIKYNIDHKTRKTFEKEAQSKLVILNNNNKDSKWFCVDIEWARAFENQQQKDAAGFTARFDIIAISKKSPHKVALIELKYGYGAIGGTSGIYKHIKDFSKYQKKEEYFCFTKKEIVKIIESQKMIGVYVPGELKDLKPKDITGYEFYVITLDNNSKTERHSAPKQKMAACLFKEKRWGCIKLSPGESVEEKFGDVTNKSNKPQVSFLFSKQTLANLNITDIIDGTYDDKEIPQ